MRTTVPRLSALTLSTVLMTTLLGCSSAEEQEAADWESITATLEAYLPKQLGDDEIRSVVEEVIAATGAASMRDMGKVMGGVMQQLKGRADGRRINAIARELLS